MLKAFAWPRIPKPLRIHGNLREILTPQARKALKFDTSTLEYKSPVAPDRPVLQIRIRGVCETREHYDGVRMCCFSGRVGY